MAILGEVTSKERKMALLESHKKMPVKKSPVKNIFSNMQTSVITDPIDPKRISKDFFANRLTMSSAVKAGLVFFATVGSYYLAKTTGIFSYFGWEVKAKNSKDVGSSKIMEVKNRANALSVVTNLETIGQANSPSVNQIITAKDEGRTVAFEGIKVEEFKNLPKIKKENVIERRSVGRRSIVIQNPIPDQNILVKKLFNLTIDGTSVFSSSGGVFLEATNIPTWLTSYCNPTSKGSYDTPSDAKGVALFGNYAYVADYTSGLQIIDISNPSNPTFEGSYDTPDVAYGVAISKYYAYVVDGNSGLQIIDIRNPLNPTFKGSYDTPGLALGVAVSSNYAYVADFSSGLQIIDISDPATPIFKGSYDTPDYAHEIALSGNYAYVADYGAGLQIIDISDLSNPTLKGPYDMLNCTKAVAVSGNYAYVADQGSGLQIVDISDPANPTFKGSYDTLNWAEGVALSGSYAYVAAWDSGLQIIDISDPSNPTFKGSYDTPGLAHEVAVSSNYAYVADEDGLQIIAPNLDKLILSGTSSSVGTYGVDIKACNEAKECITDSFDIHVINIDPNNILDWPSYVGIGTATTFCVGVSLFSAIFATIIVRSCKQRKNKKILDKVDDIELELTPETITDDNIGKIEGNLTKKAKEMAEAIQDNQTSTVIELSKELRGGEIKHGSQLKNPGIIAVKFAQVFESDEFNTLDNKTKQKVFECFEKYFGLQLVVSIKANQIVVADYQEKMLKLIESFKQTVPKENFKNNYKIKFSLDAIEQAMKNLKTTESDLKTLLMSAINIKETGTLFTTLVEEYKKIPGDWYPKMITNRYTAYKSRSDIKYLSALQKILTIQKDWHILIDGINSLVDIVLSTDEDKIKNQVFLDDKESEIRGLPIRMETVKRLVSIIKYSKDSNLKAQAFSLISERKTKEEDKNICTFIENFEKKMVSNI
jgi:hypothetical protein